MAKPRQSLMFRSKALRSFIAILVIGAFLYPVLSLRIGPWVYFPIVIAVGVLAGILSMSVFEKRSIGGASWFTSSEFLCDTCKYDNERDCRRPERPNARRCPDYKRR